MVRIVAPMVKVNLRGKEELRVYPHFAMAPYFAVIDLLPDGSKKVEVIPNPYSGGPARSGGGRGRMVQGLVLSLRPDILIATGIGPGAFYSLQSLGIRLYRSKSKDIDGIVEEYRQGRLQPLTQPTDQL